MHMHHEQNLCSNHALRNNQVVIAGQEIELASILVPIDQYSSYILQIFLHIAIRLWIHAFISLH